MKFKADNNILHNIVCTLCGKTLPPHRVGQHLDPDHPIHICPHDGIFDDDPHTLDFEVKP